MSGIHRRCKESFFWILLLCFSYAYCQDIVEKSINSEEATILIDFDVIDHIQLFNTDNDARILVHAEGSVIAPSFDIIKGDGHVMIRDYEQPLPENSNEDKVCSVEPNYTSYQIYLPKNRTLYVSFIEGNFYADGFRGDLNLKIEDGIVKLKNIQDEVHISINSGTVSVEDVENCDVDAATNMGLLISDLLETEENTTDKQLKLTSGNPMRTLFIRAILANIYLYRSKG